MFQQSSLAAYYAAAQAAISGQFLLDLYPDAEVAYSFRKLKTGQQYMCKLRRSSDNGITDVEFDANNELSLESNVSSGGTLADWVGGNDAFLHTWYDQSGNENHQIQSINTRQPKIITAGIIELYNGKPICVTDGTNFENMYSANVIPFSSTNNIAIFPVFRGIEEPARTQVMLETTNVPNTDDNSSGTIQISYNVPNDQYRINLRTGNAIVTQAQYNGVTFNQQIDAIFYDNSGTPQDITDVFVNSEQQTLNTVLDNGVVPYKDNLLGLFGRGSGSQDFFTELQEMVIYLSDQSANRIGIEANMNFHYRVFNIGILDLVPDASYAFSLRNLSLGWDSSVVEVRRASDNAEQNFTATEVENGTLATFCSGTDGFVKTWYDQSGKGRNVSQSDPAKQPMIVDNGTVLTLNDKPAIKGDGIDDWLNSGGAVVPAAEITKSGSPWAFVVSNWEGAPPANETILAMNTTGQGENINVIRHVSQGLGYNLVDNLSNNSSYRLTPPKTGTFLFSAKFDNTGTVEANERTSYFDGKIFASNTGSTQQAQILGTVSINMFANWIEESPSDAYISEVVFYGRDVSAERLVIDTNINEHYNIYAPLPLAVQPNPYVAFSLRVVNPDYLGAVVRGKRISDNSEQDFTDIEIVDGTLAAFGSGTTVHAIRLYDQSNNVTDGSRDLFEAEDVSLYPDRAPILYEAGSPITEGGKPAMQFARDDGDTNRFIGNTAMGMNVRNVIHFAVYKSTTSLPLPAPSYVLHLRELDLDFGSSRSVSMEKYLRFQTSTQPYLNSATQNVHEIFSVYPNTENPLTIDEYNYRVNGVVLTPDSLDGGTVAIDKSNSQYAIGGLITNGNNRLQGTIQEVITYEDWFEDTLAVESAINAHYETYYDGFLKDIAVWFDLASVGGPTITDQAFGNIVLSTVFGSGVIEINPTGSPRSTPCYDTSALDPSTDVAGYTAVLNKFDFYDADFTTNIWIYVTAVDSSGAWAINHRDGSPPDKRYFQLVRSTANEWYSFSFFDENNDINSAQSPSGQPLNQWQMITGVKTGNSLKVYIDGVEAVELAIPETAGEESGVANFSIGVGNWTPNSTSHFGRLWGAALWGRALSESEITTLYNGGNGLLFDEAKEL